ncbi:MAG: N-acetylmuramoyl-L-alanine amidase [Ruminococcus bovis]|nr:MULTISPECIES: N-acetylmuramoyl-L-alanine amidase [Ruminococcus]MCI6506116.1 N-acetylmuramoyl-L-alanine amidase [Ruminococcus sp.]MDY3661581.1 N-acetylmuramoyl-L-alanine amidase [Ruminococcus bovis]
MKRIISFSLLIVFLISLAGCGKSSENTESTEQSKATSQSVTSTNTENTTEKKATESSTTKPTEKKGILSGFKVLLDAGHGCSGNYVEPKYKGASDSEVTYENSSTGATGVVTKKREGDLTLEIALKLQKKLQNLGADVLMIRTKKTTPMSLVQRAEYGNKHKVDLAFRIHADGLDDQSVNGASTLYPSAEHINNKIAEKSKNIASIIQREYIKSTGLADRGTVERNDLVGFNFTTVPCILLELGFMTNPEEDRKMSDKKFQEKMVDGITNGMIAYYTNKH